MMELMQKETTLDTLARMMVEGFTSMQAYMDQRFDRLEQELAATNRRIDAIIVTLDDHARRIKDLELAK